MAKAPTIEIPEAKIRNAIWYLKTGKTKKFVCEFLNIPYNTKKLDSIIEEFHKRIEREKELKKAAKNKIFSEKEKEQIAKQYLSGDAISAIAKDYFISPQKVKNILIETNTPLRGRGKNTQGKVDHIVQDLETKFKKGDKVFFAKHNCFATIYEVFDEEYLEYLENGRQRYIETYPFKPGKNGLSGKHTEPVEGIHYEIYWVLEDNKEIKLSALRSIRDSINKIIEETGREYYRVWREGEESAFYHARRDELYPVKAS